MLPKDNWIVYAFFAHACLLANCSDAAIPFTGTFEGNPGQGVPVISGSFTAIFDDSIITPTTSSDFEISLSTFSLTPNPIGSTYFDLNVVGATVIYRDGALLGIGIGGLTSNPMRAIEIHSNEDDFAVLYLIEPVVVIDEINASVATNPMYIGQDKDPTGTLTIIPEPTPLGVLLLSSLLFLFKSRSIR
jgi:hypothetical protein